jgi:ribose-phosphate pyrophosphokinase
VTLPSPVSFRRASADDRLRIFTGNINRPVAEEIGAHLGLPLSPLEISRFSNDNLHVQIQENVRERDVFVVQSFVAPVGDHILELMITLDALRSASARRVTAVIPYHSYARSDKKDAPRISIAGRLFADMLRTAGANRVLTLDLHADQVQGFFSVPVDHLTAIPLLATHFRARLDPAHMDAVATDAGGAKRVRRFSEHLGGPMAIIDKRRVSDTDVLQGHVVGDVRDRDAVIVDDEISTADTRVATVRTLREAGARSIHAAAVHGVLCGPAVERREFAHGTSAPEVQVVSRWEEPGGEPPREDRGVLVREPQDAVHRGSSGGDGPHRLIPRRARFRARRSHPVPPAPP